MLTLLSKDNEKIKISKEAVKHSGTLSALIKSIRAIENIEKINETKNGNVDDYNIPVSHENANALYLGLVVEYMEAMKEYEPDEQDETSTYLPPPEMTDYEMEFIELNQIEEKKRQDALVDILILAQYLKITSLVNILSYKISTFIAGKQPDEIRATFGIEDDLTTDDLKKL